MLYAIDDEEWHSLSEVAGALEWPLQRVVEVSRYLAQGRFINFDEQAGKVKLQAWVGKFPRGEWVNAGKRSTGTVSVSADGSVMLQGTVIHNGLDVEAEINFIVVDEKLVELLITRRE
jgi:hypothetical protein